MSVECYPISVLPHISQLYRDYLAMGDSPTESPVRGWYGSGASGGPFAGGWLRTALAPVDSSRLAEELLRQNQGFGSSPETLAKGQSGLDFVAILVDLLMGRLAR